MSISPYSGSTFKRSTLHFLTGKVIAALITFVTLLLLVRLLATDEYGAYIVLVAGIEISLAFTAVGLPWVAARYLPEFRIYAGGRILAHFVWQVVARIGFFLVAGALLLFIALPWLLPPLDLKQYTSVAEFYLVVLVIEGVGRYIRESIFGALMQQGQAQISQVLRNLVFLLIIVIVTTQGSVHLNHVVLAELVASILGTILALRGLIRYLHVHRSLPEQANWQAPNWLEMWSVARFMYFNSLVTYSYSPQVFVFLIQRYLGAEATALFGFLRALYDHVSRYLPATLLFGLIRPKLVASFVGSGGMDKLASDTNLIGKLSLFVLMPILVFAWLAGNDLLILLSGGKFSGTNNYLGGLLVALIPLSQRQILETVAVSCEKSYLCFLGAFVGITSLPLAYLMLEFGQGLWSVIVAITVSQILFDVVLIMALTIITTFRFDSIGFFKLIVAALIEFILVKLLAIPVYSWLDLFIIGIFSYGFFLLIAYFVKPFHMEEQARLNRLFNRKFFIW